MSSFVNIGEKDSEKFINIQHITMVTKINGGMCAIREDPVTCGYTLNKSQCDKLINFLKISECDKFLTNTF